MIATALQMYGRVAANLFHSRELRLGEDAAKSRLSSVVRTYAAWWLVSLLAFAAAVSLMAAHKPIPSLVAGPLEDKLAYYHEHKLEYGLILLGDSLTFTGLHPEFIDPALGSHSVNMATFAHWFASQYPFIQDLIPEISPGTRVLWSVHLYDFDDGLSVQHTYPVGLINALRYWSWGAHNPGLAENVLYYNPLTRFFFERDELRSRVLARGDIPVSMPRLISPAFAEPSFPAAPAFVSLQNSALPATTGFKTKLTEFYSRWLFVHGTDPISDHGQINSVILYLNGGGYYRIELTPEYFREKQREMARGEWHLDDKDAEKFTPPPLGRVSLKMFESGLAAFRQARIPVTINVMEEAPFIFPNEIVRKKYRRFIDDTLQPIVRRFGDDYVHADYSSISDTDYFDYNHFNSNGIAKYTPLLVQELRKLPAFANKSGN